MTPLVAIAGPTGAGKSRLAVRLALAIRGEIVNYDSVQIYRGFDIGSAKPDVHTRSLVPHHLFDIVDADEAFDAAEYARRARIVCREIVDRGNRPILTGGTFFYLRALLAGLPEMPGRDEAFRERLRRIAARPRGPMWLHEWLSTVDPVSAARIAAGDRHRVERALEVWVVSGRPISAWQAPSATVDDEIPAVKIALLLERSLLHQRIDARVELMYGAGLVEETRDLLARCSPASRPFQTIGYKEAAAVVHGAMGMDAAKAETKRRTRAYAKRQMTWLRSERNVQWIDAADEENTFAAARRLLETGSG